MSDFENAQNVNEDTFENDSSELESRFEPYTPIVSSAEVANLGREKTMMVLKEVKKIAIEAEEYDSEIRNLVAQKSSLTAEADKIRKQVSKNAKIIIWTVTLVAALMGSFVPVIGNIIFGVVALIVMNLTVKKSDLKKHKAENDMRADAFIAENIDPVQQRLDELYALQDALINNGKRDWAYDIVGKDLFYSLCIQDLYNLIQSRRADNLKEALNKYDDTQYKARMEEMQAAIQNASEVTARESVKQTEYARQTEKNTHQAATAAKSTAYHTRQIDNNTRRFR